MAENITGDHLRKGFESPEPIFRPAPFWSWNSVMDHGEIVERGSHDELYAANGVYRRLCDMQQTAS